MKPYLESDYDDEKIEDQIAFLQPTIKIKSQFLKFDLCYNLKIKDLYFSLSQNREIIKFDKIKEKKNDFFMRDKQLYDKSNRQLLELTTKKRD